MSSIFFEKTSPLNYAITTSGRVMAQGVMAKQLLLQRQSAPLQLENLNYLIILGE